MSTFNFTVLPAGIAQFHDALSCLAKFDENVSLEANSEELRLSSLNSSKTAYASFIFNAGTFFNKYHFSSSDRSHDQNNRQSSWACRIQNRALLAIFRRRQIDAKEKDTFIERCEFELQASADEPQCRLVVRFFCRLSVVKVYKLTYETAEVLHATFDKQGSKNTWTLSARALRDIGEYFGPKTEHVDWSLNDGKVTFTSYADKIQVGKEIIRQPMHTSVALDERDFETCKLEPNQHISIHVKDFRSIVAHADIMKASVKTLFSKGQRPLQMTYGSGGLAAEFTLMTKGTSGTVTDTTRANTPARGLSVRPTSQQGSSSRAASEVVREANNMPPPASVQIRKTLPNASTRQASEATEATTPDNVDTSRNPAPSASLEHSMFFPAADDDQRWEPPNFEEDDGMVTWDNEVESVLDASTASRRRNRGTGTDTGPTSFRSAADNTSGFNSALYEIGPTQRLSQMKGMFD